MISAVNGSFRLDNICCFRYRVKLNNPLMGTETRIHKYLYSNYNYHHVKLNNPLMGTETIFRYILRNIAVFFCMLN